MNFQICCDTSIVGMKLYENSSLNTNINANKTTIIKNDIVSCVSDKSCNNFKTSISIEIIIIKQYNYMFVYYLLLMKNCLIINSLTNYRVFNGVICHMFCIRKFND